MYLSDYLLYRSLLSEVYQAYLKRRRLSSALEGCAIFTFSSFCITSEIYQIKCHISLNIKITITLNCYFVVIDTEFKTHLLKCSFMCIYTPSR